MMRLFDGFKAFKKLIYVNILRFGRLFFSHNNFNFGFFYQVGVTFLEFFSSIIFIILHLAPIL